MVTDVLCFPEGYAIKFDINFSTFRKNPNFSSFNIPNSAASNVGYFYPDGEGVGLIETSV